MDLKFKLLLRNYVNEMKFIYEGKAKRVYEIDDDKLILEFKDDVTAFNGLKKDYAYGKGIYCAALSACLFKLLEDYGIKTHYIDYDGCRKLIVKKTQLIPIEVIVRNYAYGSLIKRMPFLKPFQKLSKPIIEFHLKNDNLHDPLVLENDVIEAGLLTENEVKYVKQTSLKVNEILTKILSKYGLTLIDFKIEFGKLNSGEILIIDEFSGDTMRVIDENKEHLDKEYYRKGGSVQELVKRYKLLLEKLDICREFLKCT